MLVVITRKNSKILRNVWLTAGPSKALLKTTIVALRSQLFMDFLIIKLALEIKISNRCEQKKSDDF